MNTSRIISLTVAIGTLLLASFLLWYRGGYLAWIGIAIGILQLFKYFVLPHRIDHILIPALSIFWALAWIGVFYAVILGWEKGEVTSISIPVKGKIHTARIWILDQDGLPIGTYVTKPEVVAALRSETIVSTERNGVRTEYRVEITDYADLAPEHIVEINMLYGQQYAELNNWTTIYYAWLGSIRSRQTVLLSFYPA